MRSFIILVFLFYTFSVCRAKFGSIRCRCICQGLDAILQGTDSQASRLKRTTNDPDRNRCNCDVVMLPFLKANLTMSEMREFCSKCTCQFQIRKFAMIKIVIMALLWVLLTLVVYMVFVKPSLHPSESNESTTD